MSKHVCAPLVRASVAAIVGGFALMGWSTFAWTADADADEDDELTEVQVTGTRIVSPNVKSANPVESITGEEMRRLGIVNVADALTTLVPQNISTYMPTLIGDDQAGFGGAGMETLDRGSFFIGNTIANLRGLDPTFGSRTLTMIDGRRVVSTSNQADVVDLNIIPSNLLQRMDVVTGGASATYGSGAMAGVVNLVLNNRMTGVNLDMDYGLNEAGDGNSPHVSVSGGTPFAGGKGHMLVGLEWQKQDAIRDCAAARSWCAESRAMFTNSAGLLTDPAGVLAPLPGYEAFPARFEMANVRYSQFAPTGTIRFNNANVTSDYRFTPEGADVEEYSLGYRGGTGGNSINGDGPLTTSGTAMRPSSDRKTLFTNFEFDFTERTTGYFQGNYAKTEGVNKNRYTTGDYCVRFDQPGINQQIGAKASEGQTFYYGAGVSTVYDYATRQLITNPTRSTEIQNGNFRAWLGSSVSMGAPGAVSPYWNLISTGVNGVTLTTPPNVTYANATANYRLIIFNTPTPNATNSNVYWLLESLTIKSGSNFNDPGTPAVLPNATGPNAYAYLKNLSPEALYQLQRAFGAPISPGSTTNVHGAIIDPATGSYLTGASVAAGGGTGLDTIYGPSPCSGFTAMRKVWNPQINQWTTNESETMRAVLGVRGRFGRDWRWDVYYQYGQTDSVAVQSNVATNLRLAMALDAVIDPVTGQPVCRVTRDGVPVIDYQGRPVSELEDLRALADDCKPINIFGSVFTSPTDAANQQAGLDYAFVDSTSKGNNSLQVLSATTSGTLWDGWAGPLTGAFGVEVRQDQVDNVGTSASASYYERADLSRAWSDGFGGKTRATEGYTELNMPLVAGQPGINLWSLNLGARYASYYNKGGAGTTGQDATQNVFNWKVQTVFEPWDWVRLRLTRSRDLRTAGYRELFINTPRLPDQFAGNNPWRERTAFSTEPQFERWGQVQVGNPDLKPEKSDTLTIGLVLSPGGWAQGMRFSVDYFAIRIKDAISTSFRATNPIQTCWEESGNVADEYIDGTISPDSPGVNGLIDESNPFCQEITFGLNPDGTRNLQDIVSYNSARPQNNLPTQRRGIDLSWNYMFPLNRAIEGLPGSVSLTLRATRALEASGLQVQSSAAGFGPNPQTCGASYDRKDPENYLDTDGDGERDDLVVFNRYTCVDGVGQIRSSVFVPGVAASPKWSGNIQSSYILGDFTASLSARYIGASHLDNTWADSPDDVNYQNADGKFLNGSVDNNWVKPYFNFALNGSYNLHVGDLKQFQVFGSINNLFDKSPPFTGGGISGASAQYHDTMGRSYRMGVRLRF